MVGRKGQILLHYRVGSPPELHSVYEMRELCNQHGDGLSSPSLLFHSATYVADGCSRSTHEYQ